MERKGADQRERRYQCQRLVVNSGRGYQDTTRCGGYIQVQFAGCADRLSFSGLDTIER